MPNYKYSAIDKSGKKIEGKYTANSKEEVLSMLRQNNYYPMKVEEDRGSKDLRIGDYFRKIKTKDIAIFCRQFYTLLNAGITIISCLDILKLQTENKKLAKVIGDVHDDVQKGLTFSESLKKQKHVFPELLINMVEAGEVSGNLDVIMERMAFHYEKENKINNKIKGAMAYPIILSIVAVGVVTFLLTFVMPTFVGMFESSGVELPLPTRILLSISNGIKNYWYIHLLTLSVGIYAIIKYTKSERGKMLIGIINFRIPIVKGITQKIITSRFTRTLSTLLSSGVPLIQALEIVAKIVGNIIVEKGILEAKEEVRKGIDLASPLEKIGVFPPMVTSMIKIGEESGSLDEILEKTADFYDEELETALGQITTLIEPIMIIVMGGVVGFIVIAMMLPMFDMVNTIDM
ncbi:type II secretion system F family protein [Tepidibacter hydrothermalis]|uniref:Type II secretion system F family protein n=1 Tax=Tepidibacter hydrothermalis TaxID=3036126 RepID=A0ABY8EGZ0_9FIRM|nr:type II secretion system F family protein [Tepidibacter hydrothermalis]WFD11039.1 type II secretion system F family protein [Tepidibacter hydrothermalis]